jgi:hypothetical protein
MRLPEWLIPGLSTRNSETPNLLGDPRDAQHERAASGSWSCSLDLDLCSSSDGLLSNWGQYETEEGKPELGERMDFIHGWCREHGLSRFYGHMLVWSPQEDEPDGTEIPHWLFGYSRAAQDRLLKQRIQREVRAYRDVDMVWDVTRWMALRLSVTLPNPTN